ncbi:hypothetical protein CCACVL1_03574 [Corchorus capsularis]|uniref:DUF4220 domain-containing protein n=1 Tax=Corchorus capsularis TaxID=210143 RepID=A0A1R3JYG1_COCAP|nr:hypothetical protein CCACVL1_03574 [Corchorus capsularis]
MASRSSLAKNTKLIADFMAYEHEISNNIEDELDPMYMCRYNYVVAGDDDDDAKMDESVKPPLYYHRLAITDEVITIKKIYRCRGRLLSPTGDPEHKLKDICLSFALYRLLCRRFGGYPFAECNLEKTWNLIRYGLLSKEEDYERAFRVIEQELSFLFDLFYTKYAVIFNGGFRLLASRVALSIGLTMSCFLAVNILSNYKPSKDYVNLLTASGRVNIDKLITGVVIIGICIMEIIQFILIMISNWSKVMWICKYVKNESFQKNKHFELFMKMIIRCRSNSKPWERKLGQYSLLQSFNQDPNIFSRFISKLTGDIIPLPRGGQKESPSIELPWVVKKAVILSLRNNGPKLSNGKASLQRNQVGNLLSWACELETTTHVIIIWHIATNLCRIKLAASKLGRDEDFVTIATALSHYCAYLMTFASRLLPGHAAVTDFIFDRVVNEARKLLDGCESENQKHEKLMNLLCEGEAIFNEEEATLIEKGALLGKHLIEGIEDNGLRWKVLADFWAELMLFVAPSDDARTHAEHLAKGGEFITHLWALLSHAGILKQDQTQTAAV